MTLEEGPVPLYQQLVDLLRADIESGRLLPNQKVPSETTLQQEHGISRVTARHALGLLREAGLIVTVRGKGSYVAER